VDSALGPLECVPDPTASVGAEGTVAVRLEFIAVVSAGAAGEALSAAGAPNYAPATVTSALFLGEHREVEAQAGGEKLMLRVPGSQALTAGQGVLLHLDPAGCRFTAAPVPAAGRG